MVFETEKTANTPQIKLSTLWNDYESRDYNKNMHVWKACNRQNRFAGSNPVLSAFLKNPPQPLLVEGDFIVLMFFIRMISNISIIIANFAAD